MRELIRDGVVGDVHFVTSSRMNLGKYNGDGVVCDLAPHDLSILLYWLEQPVVGGRGLRLSVLRQGVPETAFMTLTFAAGPTANVQISWLAPRKVRQMIVVGSQRMVQYDDTASDEPVRDLRPRPGHGAADTRQLRRAPADLPHRRRGDPARSSRASRCGWSSKTSPTRSARARSRAPTSRSGLEIVATVELAQASMRAGATPLTLAQPTDRVAA